MTAAHPSQMTDSVERLRFWARWAMSTPMKEAMLKAASEIEEARKAIPAKEAARGK